MADERVQRRLAAILAADVVGFSRLMGEDETGTLAVLKEHLSELIRPSIAHYRGRVVKTTGDGVLAEFASAVDAVLCAREIQDRMAERNAAIPPGSRIEFRIGVNVGDILVDGDDIFGDGVNVAARLESLCRPGGVCISGTVYDQVRGKLELGFGDLGGRRVKNIAEPIRVYEVVQAAEGSKRIENGSEPARRPKRSIIWLAVAAVILAGLAIWGPFGQPPQPSPGPAAPEVPADRAAVEERTTERPSLAVLPIENLVPDEIEAWAVEGLTDDLESALSQVAGLVVVAPGSGDETATSASNARKTARDLGVGYVAQGRLGGTREHMALELSLVAVGTGQVLLSDRYDITPDRRFSIRGEIAGAIAASLSVGLTEEERRRLSRPLTGNMAAYDTFLQARSLESGAAGDVAPILEARALYKEVMSSAPDFAGGLAGVASTLERAAMLGRSDVPADDIAEAQSLARKAVELDDEFVMARQVLAFAEVASGNLDTAISIYEVTLLIEPSNASAHAGLGITLAYAGRPQDGAGELREAIDLDPLNFDAPYRKLLGLAEFSAGRFEEAIAAWEEDQTLQGLDPTILAALAAAYSEIDLADRAEDARRQLLDHEPNFSAAAYPLLRLFAPAEHERLEAVLVKAGLPE